LRPARCVESGTPSEPIMTVATASHVVSRCCRLKRTPLVGPTAGRRTNQRVYRRVASVRSACEECPRRTAKSC
jgi:hypothetical protein